MCWCTGPRTDPRIGSGTSADKVFGPNYPRLRALKARYDPNDVFSKKHGLGKRLPANEIIAEAKAIPVAETASPIHGEAVVDEMSALKIVATVSATEVADVDTAVR